ncbi:hypothetical protein CesoFtcFv8_008302 [Champsocephalus esox]|uniref:Uncharacterized protein n=1 Tax=Champsocephalus esox TaxID=159716 RepID=A0AAN8C7Z8_9TELE|nr:hypothetical protein CesoFtcFv8_008302 [Champsocephalus esox]
MLVPPRAEARRERGGGAKQRKMMNGSPAFGEWCNLNARGRPWDRTSDERKEDEAEINGGRPLRATAGSEGRFLFGFLLLVSGL